MDSHGSNSGITWEAYSPLKDPTPDGEMAPDEAISLARRSAHNLTKASKALEDTGGVSAIHRTMLASSMMEACRSVRRAVGVMSAMEGSSTESQMIRTSLEQGLDAALEGLQTMMFHAAQEADRGLK